MPIKMTDLHRVFELKLISNGNNSYLKSYSILLQQVAQKEKLSFEDIVGIAHMVYGWMPTILTLHFDKTSQENIVRAINSARERLLDFAEIELLKGFINNSLVGASKLLHFVSPEKYAIWDSKIYFFLFQKSSQPNTIGKIEKYFEYLHKLNELEQSPKFPAFHAMVNTTLNYPVSAKRALEIVMFENSKP